MNDPHDPRDFEQFVKLRDDGTVSAVFMRAVGTTPTPDGERNVVLNVTHLGAVPLDHVVIDAGLVTAMKDAATALETAALAHAQAFADHAAAERITLDAFSAALTPKAEMPGG